MANLLYANQYITTTLSVAGGIDDSQTTGIVLASTASLDCAKPGMALATYADPLDTSVAEWIEYTSINSSTKALEGVTRGSEGFSAKDHNNGAAIAFPLTESHINRIVARLTGDVANSVNYVQQTDAATGNAPVISATGGDDNINLDLIGKGTGTVRKPTSVSIQVFDGATDTVTGDGKFYFTIPEEINGMNLVGVHAAVVTAGTTNTTDIQIANVTDSVDMLSTKLTIDSGETSSATAATAAVIDTTKDDVVTNDLLRIDVDAVSTTPAKGLIVRLRFALP